MRGPDSSPIRPLAPVLAALLCILFASVSVAWAEESPSYSPYADESFPT